MINFFTNECVDLNTNGALDGGEPSDTTDGSGAYDINGLATGTYSVQVDASTVAAGFTLTTANLPTGVNLTSGEDFNGADFGYQLPIEISINDVDGAEGNSGVSTLIFEVTLSQASQGEITVDFATSDVTATQNIDYTASSGTLTFAAGIISQPVDIEILGDFNIEPNETFSVELTNPTLASIDDDQGIGTINDDDLGADLSVNLTVTPTDAMVGDSVVFTMQITNAGPDTALDVTASLDLLSSFAYMMSDSTQGSCQNTNGLVECDLGDVTAGQMIESTVTTTLLQSGGISITANVNSAVSDDNNLNNNSSLATFNGAPVAVPVFSWFGLLMLMGLMAFLTFKTFRPKA